jgi:selenocysteine-specific elongation factor
VLDQPVSALNGDRFIVRDQSATRTIGGGTVLDPFPPRARRSSPARLAELKALAHPSPGDALAALLENPDGAIDLARFELLFNLTSERAAALYAEAGLMQIGRESRVAIPRKRHDELRDAAVAHVAAFHRAQPQAPGVEVEAVRAAVAADLSTEIFTAVLRALADERKLEITGTSARLPGHNATANAADDQLWQTIRPALEAAGYAPPALRDLALQLKLKEAIVKDFLYRKAKSGAVYRVTTDRFYSRDMLATLAATAQATAQAQANGLFTAAQFRDATGIGRSLAIEILEFLDTLAITQRVGDARKMRKDFVPILGAASPAPRPAAGAAKAASAPPASPPRSFHKPRR